MGIAIFISTFTIFLVGTYKLGEIVLERRGKKTNEVEADSQR